VIAFFLTRQNEFNFNRSDKYLELRKHAFSAEKTTRDGVVFSPPLSPARYPEGRTHVLSSSRSIILVLIPHYVALLVLQIFSALAWHHIFIHGTMLEE
jgi:hypothetical protein